MLFTLLSPLQFFDSILPEYTSFPAQASGPGLAAQIGMFRERGKWAFILCALVCVVSPLFADYYSTLGVERTADTEEIFAAYRKMAKRYHPDLNPGDPSAKKKFKEVQTAFEVLSVPEKRKRYDLFGEGLGETSPRSAYARSQAADAQWRRAQREASDYKRKLREAEVERQVASALEAKSIQAFRVATQDLHRIDLNREMEKRLARHAEALVASVEESKPDLLVLVDLENFEQAYRKKNDQFQSRGNPPAFFPDALDRMYGVVARPPTRLEKFCDRIISLFGR
jgi:curved DNA-binding protein CbpA